MSNSGKLKLLDMIGGSSVLAIQGALGVLQRHKPDLDLSQYKIEVVRDRESDVVIFAGENGHTGKGDVGVRPGSEAELNGRDLTILRSNTDRITVLDTIQGNSFVAVEAALEVFRQRKQNLDLTQYKIKVVRDRDSVVVIFADKDRPEGMKGSPPGRPGFAVQLAITNLDVLGSHFVR